MLSGVPLSSPYEVVILNRTKKNDKFQYDVNLNTVLLELDPNTRCNDNMD